MKKILTFLSVLFSLAACSSPSVKDHAWKSDTGSTTAFYVPADMFKAVQFDPPPAADSEAQKTDLAVVRDWQGKRTDADCDRANRTFFVAFDSLWGEKSPFPEPLPAEVRNFFDRLDSDIGNAARVMKDRYRRPRPEIPNPCPGPNPGMKKGGGYSYPSSHTVLSRVFADVLADLVPDRQAEFIARADGIARDRVIIGVHYPSDIAAGKYFGDLFHAELLKSEAYRADLEKQKALLAK